MEVMFMLFKRHGILFNLFLVVLLIALKGSDAEVYTVGDDMKWDIGVNYNSWIQKYNFSVGDVLVFDYRVGQHNVYEVTEKTYKSCNSSSGILEKYESGADRVELKQAKKTWFICDIDGHCFGGMRLAIDVKEVNSTSIAPLSAPPPASSSSNKCHKFSRWGMIIFSLVVLIAILDHYF